VVEQADPHEGKWSGDRVRLDRHPLYYYSGDKGRPGSTLGQGISGFGGTWHVIQAPSA
jgi:hypothetical protein